MATSFFQACSSCEIMLEQESVVKKERERKRSRLQKLKNEQDNYKMFLQKDRLRKKLAYDAKNKKVRKTLLYCRWIIDLREWAHTWCTCP